MSVGVSVGVAEWVAVGELVFVGVVVGVVEFVAVGIVLAVGVKARVGVRVGVGAGVSKAGVFVRMVTATGVSVPPQADKTRPEATVAPSLRKALRDSSSRLCFGHTTVAPPKVPMAHEASTVRKS